MANRKIKAELEIDGKDNSGAAFKSVALRMGQVEKRIAQFNRTAKDFNKISGDFSRRVGNIERTTGAFARQQVAVSRASEAVGLAAARYLGPAAIGAGLVYATKQAGNFEESLSNIQKKSNGTAEQMAKMRSEIMQLGGEMPVSIDEIAKGFERGAAAGIPIGELKEFARLSVMVSDAWDSSAEDVSNTFAGFRVGLGIPIDKMKAYASLINDLADSGISDEKDIADFVDRTGASLRNFGMSPQEIAAYGAAMLNLKMPADVAARAMNTVSAKLLAPENLSPKAHKALQSIVGDVEKFSKLSGNDKMTAFLGSLEKLSGQRRASLLGGLLGEGFSDEIARVVAGSEEVRRNLELAHKQTIEASNSVDTVYDARMKLFNSRIELLQNNVNMLATNIGEMVLPGANSVLSAVNQGFSKQSAVNSYMEEHKFPFWKRNVGIFTQEEFDSMAYQKGYRDDGFDAWRSKRLQGPNRPAGPEFPEFPGGDHHYDPNDLPASGPMPASRAGRVAAAVLGDDRYNDQVSQREAKSFANDRQFGKSNVFGDFEEGLERGSFQAGQHMSTAIEASGAKTGDVIADKMSGTAGDIGDKIAARIAEAVSRALRSVGGASSSSVDANLGQSMPPTTGGGGGF